MRSSLQEACHEVAGGCEESTCATLDTLASITGFLIATPCKDARLMKKLEHLRPKRKLEVYEEALEDSPTNEHEMVLTLQLPLESRSSLDIPNISEPMPPTIEAAASDDSISLLQDFPSWTLPTPNSWSEESYKSETRSILQQNKQTIMKIMQSLKELVAAQKLDPSRSRTLAKLVESHVEIVQALKESMMHV